MARSTKDVQDAPIPNHVNPNSIRDHLNKDNDVSVFARLGSELLKNTNRWNVITLEEFTPFIPVFNLDKDRYERDENYRYSMNRLYNQFIRGLNINLYEPTLVVRSREDTSILYCLDRRFTRIRPDNIEGPSSRDTVPAAVSKVASATRDQLLLDASLKDLMDANNTPAQMGRLAKIKAESALITKFFTENNMSPQKRAEILGESSTAIDGNVGHTGDTDSSTTMLLDDD